MFQRHEKPLPELLTTQSNLLPGLKEKISQLISLNQLWHAQLDPVLANHCRIANFRNNCLIIEVESSAWALRLRYSLPELLKLLRELPEFAQLKTIEWYIQPVIEIEEKRILNSPPLSNESAALIRETASCVQNEKLKQALYKLAENVNANA